MQMTISLSTNQRHCKPLARHEVVYAQSNNYCSDYNCAKIDSRRFFAKRFADYYD